MTTLTELAKQIAELYPLQDKQAGKRYRIVGELAGLTELEEVGGRARYIPTRALKDARVWSLAG
ncbi:hypothetical protein D3C78_1731140 [compost metagenome]